MVEHLQRRKFAPVMRELSIEQQNCERALKLMCIVDHKIEKENLYQELEKYKLPIVKLMKFDYCLFKYYDYQQLQRTKSCLLKCRYCGLVAEYSFILTHMAINHCAHFGLKVCAYCNDVDLSAHTVASFEKCRDNYYTQNGIERNFESYLVKIFYEALEDVADKIGAVVKRNKGYVGVAQAAIQTQIKLHGHQFPQLSVEVASNCKKINDSKFQEHYRSVAMELDIMKAVPVHENVRRSDCEIINIVSDEEEPEVQLQVVSSQSEERSTKRQEKTPINNNASESGGNDESDGNEVVNSNVVRNLIITNYY